MAAAGGGLHWHGCAGGLQVLRPSLGSERQYPLRPYCGTAAQSGLTRAVAQGSGPAAEAGVLSAGAARLMQPTCTSQLVCSDIPSLSSAAGQWPTDGQERLSVFCFLLLLPRLLLWLTFVCLRRKLAHGAAEGMLPSTARDPTSTLIQGSPPPSSSRYPDTTSPRDGTRPPCRKGFCAKCSEQEHISHTTSAFSCVCHNVLWALHGVPVDLNFLKQMEVGTGKR